MQKLVASIVGFAVVAACATAGGEKGAKIEGKWVATAAVSEGKKLPDEFIQKAMLTVVFKDGKYSVMVTGKTVEEGTYKTSPSKKPAQIDLSITEGKDKGKMQLGIYKVEGGSMTIALAPHDSKDRPKSFDAGEKGEMTTFKRAK